MHDIMTLKRTSEGICRYQLLPGAGSCDPGLTSSGMNYQVLLVPGTWYKVPEIPTYQLCTAQSCHARSFRIIPW